MAFKPGSEDETHYAIRDWLMAVLPEPKEVVHPPNGFYAGKDRKKAGRHVSRLLALGLRPGFPDLIVITPRDILFLEVKRPKGGVVSDEQRDFGLRMCAMDRSWAVVSSIDETRSALAAWGVQTREVAA